MFRKLVIVLTIFSIPTGIASYVNAGANQPSLTLSPTTATEIFVGDSVTFSYVYGCDYVWTNGVLQPYDGTGDRGSPITLTEPPQIAAAGIPQYAFPASGNFSLTFASAGTFNINARVSSSLVPNSIQSVDTRTCDVTQAVAAVPVVVRERPTTTTAAPTTTIAPTTTKKEKEALPATGSNNGTALLAITVLAAGATVILARRRLL